MCSGAVHHLWRSQVSVQPVHPAPGAASGAGHHQLIGTDHQSVTPLTDVWTHFLSLFPFLLLAPQNSSWCVLFSSSWIQLTPVYPRCVFLKHPFMCLLHQKTFLSYLRGHVPLLPCVQKCPSLFPTSCSLDFVFCHCGPLISHSGMRVKGQNVVLSSAATLGQLEQCMLWRRLLWLCVWNPTLPPPLPGFQLE